MWLSLDYQIQEVGQTVAAIVNVLLDKIRTCYRNNREKARANIITLIVLGVFSYSALQATSTPRFCNRCHEMKPAVQSWQISIHSEVTCHKCHVPPGFANFFKHKARALRGVYVHFIAPDKSEPPRLEGAEKRSVNEKCGTCHSFNRTMAFSAGLNVPHKKHIEEGLICTTCHARLVHGMGGQKTRKPKMDTCMICHNGTRAPESCGVCHLTLAITEEIDG